MEEKKPGNNLARFMGQLFGVIMCSCAAAILIALTVKFIFWMF